MRNASGREGGAWSAVVVLLALALALPLQPLRAQLVRGTVTQSTSNAPVVGALVELVAADGGDQRVASALTDPAGRYALRAPSPGRFRVTAKRIGVRRYEGPPFDLAAGEARALDITLDAVEYRLPTVVVTTSTICSVVPSEGERVAALWDEARAALDAAEISLRDKLFTAQVTRYVRELEPRTKRVVRESRSEVRGVVASPFTSLPAESLSIGGYWREAAGGGADYYGPDARVLLGNDFLRDHCFRPVAGKGERAGLVGLAFAPVAQRPVPDIVGTLWLDARSFELRLVEFAYDRVKDGVDRNEVGGEVHFARLANGAWIIRRWFLRVPQHGRPTGPVGSEGSAPWVLVRPTSMALSEQGGVVTTDELRPATRQASITGVVRDSTGKRPLAGAVVRLGGTSRVATPDAEGRFVFDDVEPGAVTVVAAAPDYDALGVMAAEVAIGLEPGERRRLTVTALDARALAARLCGGRETPWGRGTLHLAVRDSASGAPLAGVEASAHWMSTVGNTAGRDSTPASLAARTDARGMVALCELPADREITLRFAVAPGGAPAPLHVRVRWREVRHLDVSLGARP